MAPILKDLSAGDSTTAPFTPEQEGIDIADLMRGRASLYGLLSRAFRAEVDEDFFDELRAMHYPQNSPDPDVNDAFRRLYTFVRHAREDTLDVLSTDYARTFLGSGVLNPYAAFPYESVYTSEHGLVMQEARDEVIAAYRRQGVACQREWHDPEDHLALELDFMRVLANRCADALATADGAASNDDADAACKLVGTQYAFLINHLQKWVPRFATDVPKYASADFYPAFAELTRATLADDQLLLEDIAEASGIDLSQAVDQAARADREVDRAMKEAGDRDHAAPTYVVTDDERLLTDPA